MKIKYDPEVDAAYILFKKESGFRKTYRIDF